MGVYAISDLHGNYELWTKVKEWLKPSDKLFCLGDNIDRGNDGIKIVQDMRNRENTTVLLGNHEDMLIDYLPGSIKYNEIFALWYRNGGQPTFDAIKKMSKEEQLDLLEFFRNCPKRIEFVNDNKQTIILCHAGFTPGQEEAAQFLFRRGKAGEYLLWNRDHFSDIFTSIDEHYNKNIYVVFGHTPVDYLIPEKNLIDHGYRVHVSAMGHKIDIDLGAAWSNQTCLLDLNTLKPIYFDLKGERKDE